MGEFTLYNQTTATALTPIAGTVTWKLGLSASIIEAKVKPQILTTTVSLGDVILVYHTGGGSTTYLFRAKVGRISDRDGYISFMAFGLFEQFAEKRLSGQEGGANMLEVNIQTILNTYFQDSGREITFDQIDISGVTVTDQLQNTSVRSYIARGLDMTNNWAVYDIYDNASGHTLMKWGKMGGAGTLNMEIGPRVVITKKEESIEGVVNRITIRGAQEQFKFRQSHVAVGGETSQVLTYTPVGSIRVWDSTGVEYVGGTESQPNNFWVDRGNKTVNLSAVMVGGRTYYFEYTYLKSMSVEAKVPDSIIKYGTKEQLVEDDLLVRDVDLEGALLSRLKEWSKPQWNVTVMGMYRNDAIPNCTVLLHDARRKFDRKMLLKEIRINIMTSRTEYVLGEFRTDILEYINRLRDIIESGKTLLGEVDITTKQIGAHYELKPKISWRVQLYDSDDGATWKLRRTLEGGG